MFFEKMQGIDVNQDNGPPNYETVLTKAAKNNSPDSQKFISFLLENFVLNQENLDRALIYFATLGNLQEVENCLKKGGNVNAEYLNNCALTEAATNNHIQVVVRLLQEPFIDVNKTNYRGESALIISMYNKNKFLIETFLKHKNIDLSLISPLFSTPFTAAIFFQMYDIAWQLIKMDKNFKPEMHPAAFNWAIRHQNVELVKALLDLGANANSIGDDCYFEDLPNWIWQELPSDTSPIYFGRNNNSAFKLPLILAMETQNIEILDMIFLATDFAKIDDSTLSYLAVKEIIQELKSIAMHPGQQFKM